MEKSCAYNMSNNNATSSSHAMPVHRTMFVKPSMSTHLTSSRNEVKRYKSILTCHYCGIIGHTHPNCFQLCSQKPWDKKHVLRDRPGIRNQVNNLCDQIKLISKKLESPTLFEKNSPMSKKEKNSTNKHVWVRKSDNLFLVAHTALKVLDTCLWYLDSACSKHIDR